jgi:DNA-binding transcriptional LysR family regulator
VESMTDLNSLVVFAKIVEANSFSEAARRLKMPVSTVSRRIADLENQLGVRLLERSTRSLRLTELGKEVLEHALRCNELSETVESIVSSRLSDVSGTLRISAPPSISDTLLTPLSMAFQASYPNVRIQILVTNRMVDHMSEGIDLAFRLGIINDATLVSRPILTYRHQLVASQAYLERCKAPKKPSDLLDHRLISFSHWRPDSSWTFIHKDPDEEVALTFAPYLAMNDFSGLTPALLAGVGIGSLPPVVQPDLLRDGRLIEVMPDWHFQTYDLSLVNAGSRSVSKACRLFKDFASQMAPILFPALPT